MRTVRRVPFSGGRTHRQTRRAAPARPNVAVYNPGLPPHTNNMPSTGVVDQLKLQLPSWVNMMQLTGFSKDFFELIRDVGEARSKEVCGLI